MSHFSVIVVGDNPEDQLAPFQENNMSDVPQEYLEFHDVEEEYMKEYLNDGTEMVMVENDELVFEWDDRFKVGKSAFETETIIPEHYHKRFVPHTERYATFDKFMCDWHGYKGKDEKTGRWGYWENPNSKWDWYALGGRWTGYFKAKAGIVGEPGLDTPHPEAGFFDSIRKYDLDLAGMRNDAMVKANKDFDKLMSILAGREVPKWDDIVAKHGKENIDAARKEYHDNRVIKDLQDAHIYPFMDDIYSVYANFDRDAYVKKCVDSCFTSFAVIKDGKWYERGSMGWWGCVGDEKDDAIWNAEFGKLIDSLPGDTLLSAYDCHI